MKILLVGFTLITIAGCASKDTSRLTTSLPCEAAAFPTLPDGFHQILDPETGMIVAEGHVQGGQAHGFWKHYGPDMTILKEGNYTRGNQEGFWKYYLEDGHLWQEGHIEDCARKGFWNIYNRNPPYNLVFAGHVQ